MKYPLIMFCSILLSNSVIFDSANSLDTVLSSYVDDLGNVNYEAIIKNPFALNEYLNFIEQISPDSHPVYFNTEDSKKAYWINVYNALILKIMIENPGKDILDIGYIGHDIFLKRFKVGNKKISPSFIENKILRKMKDPRIHFAINCASKSCPPLGNRILLETDLDDQLNQKAFNFINNTDNVLIHHQEQTIYLNKIFKWFEKDFGNLKSYISIYLDDIDMELIKNYKIKFFKYDWSKNSSE
tara:strand:- start:206 stop:931 length:726 start_codon:yes stop_codon:yes gene_type:complete